MRLTFLALVAVALLLFSSSATAVITETGTLNTDGNEVGITVDGNYAYIAARYQGLRVINISNPANPSEVGYHNTPGQAKKVVKDGDYCYVADYGGGLIIIDVSTPASPSREGSYNTNGRSNGVAVSGDYCYVADGVPGLLVFDISDRTDPQLLDSYITGGAAQDVVVSGNFAYVADSTNGLVVVDVTEKDNISLEGSLDTDGIALAIDISGNYVYIADATNGLRIIDVTSPDDPSEASALEGFDAQDVVISGNYAYIADNEFLLYMADISDPENPYGVQLYDEANDTESNGVAVSGNYAYVVGDEGGLWILNKSNLTWEKSVPRTEYFMFGIPLNVVNGDASALFRDDFSDEDPGEPNWRVSRWDVPNQTYLRYSENNYPIDVGGDPPDFSPGIGFWVMQFHTTGCEMDITIAQNSGFVSHQSRPVVTLQPMEISGEDTLKGVNMIANPFPYEYDWRNTSFTNTTLAETRDIVDAVAQGWVNGYGYTWNYDTDEYEVVRYSVWAYTVDAWEGFWCCVTTEDGMQVRFKPNLYTGGLTVPRPRDPDDEVEEEGWELNLQVRAVDGQYQDTDNILAISPEAEEGYDGLDAFEFTPVSNSFVHLYFPHPDWSAVYGTRYTYDFRSEEFDGAKVWDFRLRTWYLPETEFEITWPDIDEIPATYQFVLEDADNDEVIGDLRELNSYEFTSTDANDEMYNYRISVTYTPAAVDAEPDFTADNFELLSAYPNPFNDEMRVSFLLSASQQIILRVFNLQGREIAVLSDGLFSAGKHHVTWDASGLKSGIYFLSLKSGNVSTTEKVILLR